MTCHRLGIHIPRQSPYGTEKHGIETHRTRNIVVVVGVVAAAAVVVLYTLNYSRRMSFRQFDAVGEFG